MAERESERERKKDGTKRMNPQQLVGKGSERVHYVFMFALYDGRKSKIEISNCTSTCIHCRHRRRHCCLLLPASPCEGIIAIENEKVYWKLSAKNKDFSICIHHINRIFLRLQIGKPKQL